MGTADASTFQGHASSPKSWTMQWNKADVKEFLFATSDCKFWLIAKPDAVYGENYDNARRLIDKSSNPSSKYEPYEAIWYNRKGSLEDPIITVCDHADSWPMGNKKALEGGCRQLYRDYEGGYGASGGMTNVY